MGGMFNSDAETCADRLVKCGHGRDEMGANAVKDETKELSVIQPQNGTCAFNAPHELLLTEEVFAGSEKAVAQCSRTCCAAAKASNAPLPDP